jgi:hypothetical protein
VTASVITVGDNDDEIWYTVTARTGDPFGGYQEHYRKAPPIKGPLRFVNEPGLFRVDPTPGVVIHDPDPGEMEWFQGAESGTLDATPSSHAVTHDGAYFVTLRRGPVAVPRKTYVELRTLTNHVPETTPSTVITFDELVATASFKQSAVISPDNRYCAFIYQQANPKLAIVDLVAEDVVGSVDTSMTNQAAPGEPVWVGDYIYWPDVTTANVHVFDISTPSSPAEDQVFATSVTDVTCVIRHPSDTDWLYASGTSGLKIVSLDRSVPDTISEDTALTVTDNYESIGIDEDGLRIFGFTRSDASNVRYVAVAVDSGDPGTITKTAENTISLSTSVMDGLSCIAKFDRAIVFSERNAPGGASTLEAHVFDITLATAVTYQETLSYNNGASGNIGPSHSVDAYEIGYTFNFNSDAQMTYGELQIDTAAPLTIEDPLRVGFGGTGLGTFAEGDLLYASRDLPDDVRDNGELARLAIGNELQQLIVSGGLPAWSDAPPAGQQALTEDLDMAGFLFDNAPGLRGFIDGLVTELDTDTDHDVKVNPGVCADSLAGNDRIIRLGTEMTKQIDASWAEGDDAGGMATGTVTSGEHYNLILIHEDGDPDNADVMFDVSPTGANVPSGWIAARRIGSVFTLAGEANIKDYVQHGDYFKFADPISDVSDTSVVSGTFETATLTVPDISGGLLAHISARARGNTCTEVTINVRYPGHQDAGALEAFAHYTDQAGNANRLVANQGFVLADGNAQVEYAMVTDGTATKIDIATFGWLDPRGRNE